MHEQNDISVDELIIEICQLDFPEIIKRIQVIADIELISARRSGPTCCLATHVVTGNRSLFYEGMDSLTLAIAVMRLLWGNQWYYYTHEPLGHMNQQLLFKAYGQACYLYALSEPTHGDLQDAFATGHFIGKHTRFSDLGCHANHPTQMKVVDVYVPTQLAYRNRTGCLPVLDIACGALTPHSIHMLLEFAHGNHNRTVNE